MADRTKNTLGDLNDMLFMMAEELMDSEEDSKEEFKRKMDKARALSAVGSTIVANANLIYKATVLRDSGKNVHGVPRLLTSNPNDKNYIGETIDDRRV